MIKIIKKIKKGSNGMEPAMLIRNYNISRMLNYLNVSSREIIK
jgi:hypothetical protein